MKKKFLMFLTRHFRPCYFFKVAKGPNKDHVNCGAYRAYRNRCETYCADGERQCDEHE